VRKGLLIAFSILFMSFAHAEKRAPAQYDPNFIGPMPQFVGPIANPAKKTEKAKQPVAKAQAKDIEPKPIWSIVERRLVKEKFKAAFIKEMKRLYEKDRFGETLRLNVMLFLKRVNYHGVQVSDEAAEKVQAFINAHAKTFKKAEKEHGVPANVIASLLWIESRHGVNLGDFHVPSVYLHLAQAMRPDVQKYYETQVYRFTDEKLTKKDRIEFKKRSKQKVAFAIGELKSLQKVFLKKWSLGKEFRGSYAGAFGMAQFIPSSYVRWARALKDGTQPDLEKPDDAIVSVAYYLADHGWGKKLKPLDALMTYNNSQDYAQAILDLADKAKALDSRFPASQNKTLNY
jgi:membrane-bound lytic murein transglycosylase B